MQVYKGSVCFKCNFTEIIHKYDCCRVTLRRVTEYVKARPLKVYLILKWYMWYKKNWEKLIFPERFFSADPGNPSHKPCSINELKSLVIAVFLNSHSCYFSSTSETWLHTFLFNNTNIVWMQPVSKYASLHFLLKTTKQKNICTARSWATSRRTDAVIFASQCLHGITFHLKWKHKQKREKHKPSFFISHKQISFTLKSVLQQAALDGSVWLSVWLNG